MGDSVRMTPVRFLVAATRAVGWFVVASVEAVLFTHRHPEDISVTHRYAHRLSEGWIRIFHLRHTILNGERLVNSQPCVYLVNHRSNLDIVVLAEAFPTGTVVIGKRALLKVPMFGKIFTRGGNIVIDRLNPDDARAGISTGERAIMERGHSVWIFPEGTRNFGKLRSFKKGAFHMARNARVPIVPLVCAVPRAWLEGSRLFLRRETEVKIEVLEAVDPHSFESVDDLIEHTRGRMLEALNRLESEL